MGNFEKLSVLVIVVIIVMILVVAIYEWTGSPSEPTPSDSMTTSMVEPAGTGGSPSGEPASASEEFRKIFDNYKEPGAPGLAPVPGDGKPLQGVTPTPSPGVLPTKPTPAGPASAEPKPETPAPSATEFPETTHVVAAGESLSEIAHKHWKRASYYPKILDANPGLDPMRLRVGQKLKIPALTIEAATLAKVPAGEKRAGPTESGPRPKAGEEYTVRSGDTWESIARAAYDTVERWPEIYMKNMRKTGMKDLRGGVVIQLPK